MKKYSDSTYMYVLFSILVILVMLLLPTGCKQNKENAETSTHGYTVTDAQGVTLHFDAKPQRIVSLSISTDEILLDLVDSKRIVALSKLADDPGISNIAKQAQNIQGRATGESAELILALNPDVLLVPDFTKAETIQALRDMQLKVYVYKTPHDITSVRKCISNLGMVVGENERAQKLIDKMDKHLQEISQAIGQPSQEKSVIFMRDNGGAYYSPQSSFNEICRYAKVRNALTGLHYDKPMDISQEEVIRLNPDAFLLSDWNYDGKHDANIAKKALLDNPSYQSTKAIQNKEIYILPSAHLLAVSQYTVEAVADLARVAYGIEI